MLQILEDADSYFYDLVEVYRNIGAREMDAGDLESLVGNLEDISEFLIKMQRAVVNAFYRAWHYSDIDKTYIFLIFFAFKKMFI